MFNIPATVNVMEILDPALYPGAEYFNFFFTLIIIFGLIAFGFKVLFRLMWRS